MYARVEAASSRFGKAPLPQTAMHAESYARVEAASSRFGKFPLSQTAMHAESNALHIRANIDLDERSIHIRAIDVRVGKAR
jgi:hypothetical protein